MIGTIVGMVGGGGAILAVPMLVYVARADVKTAIETSLFAVGSTSAGAALVHAKNKNVRFRVGISVGVAAMIGAFGGAKVAHFVSGNVLLLVFGFLMIFSATMMLRRRVVKDDERRLAHPPIARAIVIGFAIGTISGFVGAGGGFLLVPALAIFGGLTIREAIGTSLFVIALQSFAGFLGHLGDTSPDVTLMIVVTGGAAVGSLLGAALGQKAKPHTLRRMFAWLVIAMGIFVFVEALVNVRRQ